MNEENEEFEKIEEEAVTTPSVTLSQSAELTAPSKGEPSAAAPLPLSLGEVPQFANWGGEGSPASAETKEDDEMQELRAELEKVRGQVARLEHERFLLGRGVPEEDLDYYAFKIEQQAGAGEDFARAAKEYLKAHPLRRTAVSSGAELGGGGTRKPATSSELMNQLLRNN